MVKLKGIDNCIIERDSITVVSWAQRKSRGSWLLLHQVREARDIIDELKVELHQVPRNQNSLVDKLAKWGAEQQAEYMRDNLPDSEEFMCC